MITLDTEGLHPASILCLEAMEWLQDRADFARTAEIGCGNGILSLMAASIWGARVVAGDISPKAVSDAKKNIELHSMQEFINAVRSDGFDHPLFHENAPYDLIICNLLAEVLVRIAADMKKLLSPGGTLLISGILSWKAAETEAAFLGLGFEIIHKISNSPWNCYILRPVK